MRRERGREGVGEIGEGRGVGRQSRASMEEEGRPVKEKRMKAEQRGKDVNAG